MIANTAPIKASSMISPVSEGENHLHAVRLGYGVYGLDNQLEGQTGSAPDQSPTRPSCPARVLLAAEEENHPR